MSEHKIMLAHGSGGRRMHDLIKNMLLPKLSNPILEELSDSAFINYKDKVAFTTDSFVVNPLFFPGGDIGKLAVCGTINDLVMLAAVPEYLSLAFIIEEGLDYKILEKIVGSISFEAKESRVCFVTGDIKVVERGACDKVFINTSGVGRIINNKRLSTRNIKVGDKIIVTGNIAQHGLAVLAKRKELDLGFKIESDCAALNDLLLPVLQKTNLIRFMRDPTRGGLATTLNEVAAGTGLGIIVEEKNIPVSGKVKVACELLGIDPLYVANEGVAVLIVKKEGAKRIVSLLRRHSLGRDAQVIGEIVKSPEPSVILNTVVGTQRIVEMLASEPLPRIC